MLNVQDTGCFRYFTNSEDHWEALANVPRDDIEVHENNIQEEFLLVISRKVDACDAPDSTEAERSVDIVFSEASAWYERVRLGERPMSPGDGYALYFWVARNLESGCEQVLYVGISTAKTNRFAAGHAMAFKCFHRDFHGCSIHIYFASLFVKSGVSEHLLPVEFFEYETAVKYVKNTEAQLVWAWAQNPPSTFLELRPRAHLLNEQLNKTNCCSEDITHDLRIECCVQNAPQNLFPSIVKRDSLGPFKK